MRNFAYKRVSTEHQETFRQLADLDVKFDMTFEDKLSGKNTERPSLKKCLLLLKKGDVLWCHSIDRLARNLEDLRDIVFGLMDRGITIKFVKEGLEFTANMCDGMKSALSKLLLSLLGAVAEFERAIINSRVVEGVAAAMKRGVKFGAANPKQRETFQRNKALGKHKPSPSRFTKSPKTESLISEIKKVITLTGASDYITLSEKLNLANITTPSNKVWSQNNIGNFCRRYEISLK